MVADGISVSAQQNMLGQQSGLSLIRARGSCFAGLKAASEWKG